MRLTFRKSEPCSVQQREPADDCRQHKYYTASASICKYSIVTKMDDFFCQKHTMKKFDAKSVRFLVVFPWTKLSYKKLEAAEKGESIKNIEKKRKRT